MAGRESMTDEDWRELLTVVRRALLMIVRWIERKLDLEKQE